MTSTLKTWPIFGLLEPEFISNIHMVLVYGDLGNSCLIVTKDQMVYALGHNCDCCITTDERNSGKSIIFPKTIDGLCGQKIKTMASGKESYVLVLTENGKVYSLGLWNCDSYNQPNCFCNYSVLKNIELLKEPNNFVVDIACGHNFAVALTQTGNVHIWGSTSRCIRRNRIVSATPSRLHICDAEEIRGISCGAEHCMAVTRSGHVHSWGANSEGQLGYGDNGAYSESYEVTGLSGIVIEKVVCGCKHTLALSDKGNLYSWGDNTFGQLGVTLGSHKKSLSRISLNICLEKVLDMAASNCANISVAMGMNHQIFIWGYCLGRKITIPTLISVDSIHDAFALYAVPRAMHQPFIIDNKGKEEEGGIETMNIMDHVMAAFDDKTFSDLTIEVQGKPIYVHKTILKIRSKYFNAMFQGDWKENNDSVVKICEFSYVAYRAFLKFLYTDEIDATIPTENVLELLQLADLCDEDNLTGSYTCVLTQRISTANTALFYRVAVQYNNSVLKRRCIEFAVKHMAEISKSSSFSIAMLRYSCNGAVTISQQKEK